MKLLGNYSRNLDLKTAIRVGVVGYPNVGKSSVINSLKRDKACGVGAVPGFTRTVQEVQLSKNIMLLDSPGIVFSMPDNSDDLVLRNCVRVDSLTDPIKVRRHWWQFSFTFSCFACPCFLRCFDGGAFGAGFSHLGSHPPALRRDAQFLSCPFHHSGCCLRACPQAGTEGAGRVSDKKVHGAYSPCSPS